MTAARGTKKKKAADLAEAEATAAQEAARDDGGLRREDSEEDEGSSTPSGGAKTGTVAEDLTPSLPPPPPMARRAVADLLAAPYNPRRMTEKSRAALAASIRRWGLVEPIVWNRRTGHVVGGHQRLTVLQEAGVEETDVVEVDLPEDEERALNLTLNNPAAQGEFVPRALQESLVVIQERLPFLLSEVDLASLVEDGNGKKDRQARGENPPGVPTNPVSKRGTWYKLGRHRLFCGDVRDVTTWPRDDLGAMVTDPPYNVSAPGRRIEGDSITDEEARALHEAVGVLAAPMAKDAVSIVFHSPRTMTLALDAWRTGGWTFKRTLWLHEQGAFAFPWRGWYMTGDVLLVFQRGKGSWPETVDYSQDTYRHHHAEHEATERAVKMNEEAAHADETYHPTIKPLWVVEDLIAHVAGDIFEPFSGSGTTIIAGENQGRAVVACEVDPAFSDQTRRRWAEYVHGAGCDWKTLTPKEG